MALDVKVKIEMSKVVGQLGFGYPLILCANLEETGTEVAYTECSSLDEVEAAGFESTTSVYKAAQLMFSQENPPAKVAVYASKSVTLEAVTAVVDKEWRQLLIVDQADSGDVKAIADYIETTNKMYFATIAAVNNTFAEAKYDRTVLFVHSDADAVAALAGEAAGREVGSFTYKNLILKGIAAQSLTEAQLEEMHDVCALTLVTKAGDHVTSEGKTQSGRYIDEVDCIDYITSQIEYRVQKVLNHTAKVPYDNRGIALLESAVITVLQDAYNRGIIAATEDGQPDYSVSFATRSQTTEDDRAARIYPYGKFAFALAGAVHTVEVTGEITY